MPFGLCNASSTFQLLMQRMFRDQQLYFKNIIVSQHVQSLEAGSGLLQREGLKVKPTKCSFWGFTSYYLCLIDSFAKLAGTLFGGQAGCHDLQKGVWRGVWDCMDSGMMTALRLAVVNCRRQSRCQGWKQVS